MRPDQKFFEYLQHPNEVFGMLWKVYKLELAIGILLVLVAGLIFWKFSSKALQIAKPWSLKTRALAFPVVVGVLVPGARSSVGHRPVNLSTASFSNNHLANELALNSTYSMLYAGYRFLKHEKTLHKCMVRLAISRCSIRWGRS